MRNSLKVTGMSRAWSDETLALTKKIVHLQDKLIADLGVALHRGIDRQNYGLVTKLLPTIEHDALLLQRSAQDLMRKRPRTGRPPIWFELAVQTKFFAIDTQEITIGEIRTEIQGGYWTVVKTLLLKCLTKCRGIQHKIFRAIPEDRRPTEEYTVVRVADELVETLEKGESTETTEGNRWRRTR